ncbi:acyl-CoA dehydrogenase family protein [Actinophytocola glycyrrhizae]|uniref:Acyl-CoA dehydrogenase family protein n=1 Tax=Actinophytocola glycyrrhizae TaxID=2044873 RepID=A0ABV9RTU4_9PSEU
MHFDLSDEQQELVGTLRDNGTLLSTPDREADGRSVWETAAELGVTGLCLPREHGGGGLGALDTALSFEALGRGGADPGLLFGIAAHLLACGIVLAEHAHGDLRADLVAGMCSGAVIAGNAMTEVQAGSDIGRIATTAEADSGSYLLNGTKSFVSNASLADVYVTYAMTTPGGGHLGMSAFAVPRNLPGIRVAEPLEKLGLAGCPAAGVEFTGCRVPRDHLLGTENEGGRVFAKSMVWERACLPAIFVGVMDRQLQHCVDHARGRRQFGRRLGDFQAVSHRIAVMKQRLESSRLLMYRACWLVDRDDPDAAAAAALAKAAVAEAAVDNGVDAVKIFGARGYLTADGIGQQLLDALPLHIFSGTTDIQRELVVKGLGI